MRILSARVFVAAAVFAFGTAASPTFAWGPVGHRMVAETAALLVENDLKADPKRAEWGSFLARHRFTLGVYAVLPDTVFKSVTPNSKDAVPLSQKESPTHYFDLDYFLGDTVSAAKFSGARAEREASLKSDAVKLEQIPLRYADVQKALVAKLGQAKADDAGSAPWRVEQFLERARRKLEPIKELPKGYRRGETTDGEARHVFDSLLELGVMSHYSGDASMPFHATSDWNGFSEGLGGIHFYFEADCINALEPELAPAVLKLAKARQGQWIRELSSAGAKDPGAEPTPVRMMLRLLFDSGLKIGEVVKLDREFALIKAAEKGSKSFASRRIAEKGCPMMKSLLTERLAKGAVVTAWLWQRALPALVPTPRLEHAADAILFYDWVSTPAYIEPDYLQ